MYVEIKITNDSISGVLSTIYSLPLGYSYFLLLPVRRFGDSCCWQATYPTDLLLLSLDPIDVVNVIDGPKVGVKKGPEYILAPNIDWYFLSSSLPFRYSIFHKKNFSSFKVSPPFLKPWQTWFSLKHVKAISYITSNNISKYLTKYPRIFFCANVNPNASDIQATRSTNLRILSHFIQHCRVIPTLYQTSYQKSKNLFPPKVPSMSLQLSQPSTNLTTLCHFICRFFETPLNIYSSNDLYPP